MSDKKKRMGDSAVNFSILDSTTKGKAPAEAEKHSAVSPQQGEAVGGSTDVDQVQTAKKIASTVKPTKVPTAVKAARPAPSAAKKPLPAKSKGGVAGKEESPAAQDNPFGYDLQPVWPMVEYKEPFLIAMPEPKGRAAAALSIRIPVDLNQTVERHCAKLGIKNLSLWLREAMKLLLSQEQQLLAKQKTE